MSFLGNQLGVMATVRVLGFNPAASYFVALNEMCTFSELWDSYL